MKKIILAVAIASAFTGSVVHAEESKPEPAATPEHTFTGNLALVSDYRFRGISQTFGKPAIQGGFDYAHSSGFYAGNWNSNVSGVQYPNGASLEMDFYGGFKFEPVKDLTADIGVLYYYYPSATLGTTGEKFDNTEIYIAGTYKWFSAKYSYGVSDFFGLNSITAFTPRGDSKGSGYLDLNGNFEVSEKTTFNLHVGRQWVKNYGEFDYTDYKVGIAREFGFATIGLAVIGTNADEAFYTASNGSKSKDLGKTTAVVSLSKTF
jgi:uncharacterized protein (TIGR02001 family)